MGDESKKLELGIHCALVKASTQSLTAELPVKLVVGLTAAGIWSPAQGLAYIGKMQDEKRQTLTWTWLAPHLPEKLLGEAQAIACTFEDEACRTLALEALGGLRAEGLATARASASQAEAASIEQALAAARAIKEQWQRVKALAWHIQRLPRTERQKMLKKGLAAARAIEAPEHRALALATLAPYLPQAEQKRVSKEPSCSPYGKRPYPCWRAAHASICSRTWAPWPPSSPPWAAQRPSSRQYKLFKMWRAGGPRAFSTCSHIQKIGH